jgi:ABC-type Fe3+-citrate transport system substrate-binding protein
VVRALEKKVEEARKVVEPAEDLKKKEAALTEELAALETIAAEVKAVRELEKKVIEARKILQEPECK